jgi:hypothetical protein
MTSTVGCQTKTSFQRCKSGCLVQEKPLYSLDCTVLKNERGLAKYQAA